MALKLPRGAEAAFRIESNDAFGRRFAINIYGAGREGWFVATHRYEGLKQDSGVQYLPEGEWLTFLGLVERCGFWALSEGDLHLADRDSTIDDGSLLTIVGRDRERYHRIQR